MSERMSNSEGQNYIRALAGYGVFRDTPCWLTLEDVQAIPIPGKDRILPLVIDDLERRAAVGVKRYGRFLESHNGRDALRDAYEEALDLCMYLRQQIAERADQDEMLVRIVRAGFPHWPEDEAKP